MISEADAREAARHLAIGRERLSKLDKEDVEFKFIARDMDSHAWRLACFAVGELARREAERVERAKPITRDRLRAAGFATDSGGCWQATMSDIPVEVVPLPEIDRADIYVGGMHLASRRETMGQLLDILAALRGEERPA